MHLYLSDKYNNTLITMIRRLLLLAFAAIVISCGSAIEQPLHTEVLFSRGYAGYDTFRIPALIRTGDGTLIAFAEARKNASGDAGHIDLVQRRSLDGGYTWGELEIVWSDGKNTCGNPSPVYDEHTGRLLLLTTWNRGDDIERAIRSRESQDTRRAFVLYSDDQGATWSEAREITESVKDTAWTWYATGPCHALQLKKGPHKGRLVIPCDYGLYPSGGGSHIIYSDDHGETWHRGAEYPDGNESTAAELPDGEIIFNMRVGLPVEEHRENGYGRLVAYSRDGGETLEGGGFEPALIEPRCQGSIVNYTRKGRLTNTLLFSNPKSVQRVRMTISKSDDGGRSWEPVYLATEEPSGYSDLAVMPDGNVALLFETGVRRYFETIEFRLLPAEIFR